MEIVLYLVAFPILPLLAAARWFYYDRKYRQFLSSIDALSPPTLEDVHSIGPIETSRKAVQARKRASALIKSGGLGARPVSLLRRERESWRLFWIAVVAGLIAVGIMPTALPRTARSIGFSLDATVVLVLMFGGLAVLGVRILIVARRSARDSNRLAAIAYLLSLVGLAAGAVIAFLWLARP
jgi:Uncharacterized conserved protein (DUF2304)